MTAVLHTTRMILRDVEPGDLDALLALDADPGVKRYIDGGLAVDRDEIAEMLEFWLTIPERAPGSGFFAAIEVDTERFLGWFHLRPRLKDPIDEPELGYRLHRDTWGRGLATEGSIALVDHAFEDLGAVRVWAETMTVNTASRRVMEKAGMRLVRTFQADWPVRIDGDELGDVEYEITRETWAARRAGR